MDKEILSKSTLLTLGKSQFRKRDFFVSLIVFLCMVIVSCAVVWLLAKSTLFTSLSKQQFVGVHICVTILLLLIDCITAITVLLFLQLKENNKKLAQAACIDQLTGLCTKQTALLSLDHELCQAARHRSHVGICFVDMDNFKNINDKYGHIAGDKILNKIADGMKSCVRGGDVVARFGGDEFLIILCDLNKHDDYQIVMNRLDSVLKAEHDLGQGQLVKAEASVGISVYPEDGSNIDELIHFADQSMYEVKRLKKSARSSAT